jgi:hypothetical protein
MQNFARDVNLIWENAKSFNGPDSPYTMYAETLRKFFVSLSGQYFPHSGF